LQEAARQRLTKERDTAETTLQVKPAMPFSSVHPCSLLMEAWTWHAQHRTDQFTKEVSKLKEEKRQLNQSLNEVGGAAFTPQSLSASPF
jgi:hypothetical protein